MKCFEVLNIAPTTSQRDIKIAYSQLLKIYHPEEYPEKFKEIHNAYQLAMKYADNPSQYQQEISDDLIEIVQFQKNSDEFNHITEKEFVDIKEDKELNEDIKCENNKFGKINKLKGINDNHIEEDKFIEIDNYEYIFKKKDKELNTLIEMFIWQRNTYGSPQKSLFKTPLFIHYQYNELFIEKYIGIIEKGLYNNLNIIEKRQLKAIHKFIYFNNKIKLQTYDLLYYALKPYLYEPKGGGLEIFLLVICMFCTIPFVVDLLAGTMIFFLELGLIIIYTIVVPKYELNKYSSRILLYRKFVISIFLIFLVFNVLRYFI